MSASSRPTVVKLGGSLSESGRIASILKIVGRARLACVIVPGGGAFADAVRAAQAEHGFSQAAAHRMAVLAMHQTGMMLCAMHAAPAAGRDACRHTPGDRAIARSGMAADEARRRRHGASRATGRRRPTAWRRGSPSGWAARRWCWSSPAACHARPPRPVLPGTASSIRHSRRSSSARGFPGGCSAPAMRLSWPISSASRHRSGRRAPAARAIARRR